MTSILSDVGGISGGDDKVEEDEGKDSNGETGDN